ncbi:hypothetical protein NQZ68_042272 [Dissostichus eleginoides]|nr:hypothetical protein NQZ68_042272 [Dissostichus eleginoides]
MLEDEAFCFFLALFHKIMPHVDMLFNQLHKRNIDPVFIKALVQKFTDSMQTISAGLLMRLVILFTAFDPKLVRPTVDPFHERVYRLKRPRLSALLETVADLDKVIGGCGGWS